MNAYANNGFSAGEDSAYSLDLPGSDRGGDENRLDDVLLKPGDEKSREITFVWEQIEFNFTTGGSNITDPLELADAYRLLMDSDWSGLTITGQDLSGRNISVVDLSEGNFSGTNFAQSNLSESIFKNTDLSNADFRGANLQNTIFVNFMGGSLEDADFTNANLAGAFGFFDLSAATLSNTTCPDGTNSDETSCASGSSQIPTPLAADLFFAGTNVELIVTPYTTCLLYTSPSPRDATLSRMPSSA